MDAIQLADARFAAVRQAATWTSLLVAAQAMEVVTTAVHNSRGTVESMASCDDRFNVDLPEQRGSFELTLGSITV